MQEQVRRTPALGPDQKTSVNPRSTGRTDEHHDLLPNATGSASPWERTWRTLRAP